MMAFRGVLFVSERVSFILVWFSLTGFAKYSILTYV